jgi:serine/threonine protein kinase/tetratricopeptide (TPR) repeat protein
MGGTGMTNVPSKTLQQILDEAQTLPPDQRLRYIREACATDSDLYASAIHELESRQQWFGEDGAAAPAPAEESVVDLAGERVGPYRIVRSLGRGGMGEVFLAARADEQFQQQVAIKLVRRGLLSRQLQGRLKLERQILATLDHPNIARLFDGGTTTDGTPYIVMEYVDGEPIDVYCDSRCLSIEQRLRLFQTICSAVHRAHQNLIVRRDLTPSNIRVTRDGTPKLLDFGIAKLLDDRHMMHTMAVTQADYRVLTPDHASPEQIRGDPITTASDTYVLGVVLYELLCACKPFTLKGNRLGDLEHAICEETPPAPSAVVQARHDAAEIARQRGASPARLRRELAGDLDNIVLMAMRKEPERRYSSVEQFAADVQRHLDGMPVLARADAWSYRAGKFLARHSLAVGLAVAFLAVLIGFSVTTYLQAQRIAQERDLAEAERARALTSQQRAEAVKDFLIDSFRLADPSHARGKEITAREILDQGAARIGKELRAQPDLQATLLDTIGSVYLSLDLPDDAQPLIEQGLAVRRQLFGQRHLDVASSLYSLNRVYEKKGDLKTAEALAIDSLAINTQLTGEQSLETAGSLCRLGVLEYAKGELANAQRRLEECLRIRTALRGPDHEDLTIPLDNLARLAQARRDFAEAERLDREALRIDLLTRGKDHPQYIRHLHNLATTLHDRGDLDGAEPLYRQTVELLRQVLGPEHTETIEAMGNLGRLLMDRHRFDEAQQTYEAALAVSRKAHPEPHVDVGYLLADYGRLEFERKRYREAEAHYREALQIYRATLPPGHGYTAAALTMLGRTLLELRQPQEAETTLQSALQEWSKEYGVSSPWYAQTRAFLGRAWALQRRFPEAEAALTETYPLLLRAQVDAEMTATVRAWIEDLYRSTGRPQQAQAYFQQLEQQERAARTP